MQRYTGNLYTNSVCVVIVAWLNASNINLATVSLNCYCSEQSHRLDIMLQHIIFSFI